MIDMYMITVDTRRNGEVIDRHILNSGQNGTPFVCTNISAAKGMATRVKKRNPEIIIITAFIPIKINP